MFSHRILTMTPHSVSLGPRGHSREPPLALVERRVVGGVLGVPGLGAGRRVRWQVDGERLLGIDTHQMSMKWIAVELET